jgi:VanZ family protein
MLKSPIRAAGWLGLLAIVVISVVPRRLRPDVLGERHIEHFAAYPGVAVPLAAGYRGRYQPILIGLLPSACAGVLEIIQLWIDGRSSSVADFVVSSRHAWAGVVTICLFGPTL